MSFAEHCKLKISSNETLTGRTVKLVLPLYIPLTSVSLFNLRVSDLSISDVKRPLNFQNLVTETFAEPSENW